MANLSYFANREQRKDGYFQGTAASMGTTGWLDSAFGDVVTVMIPYLTGGETIAITGSNDGTNFEAALKPIDVTTGQPTASTNLAIGTYILPFNYREYHFTKSAAVQLGVIAYYVSAVPIEGGLPVNLNLPQYSSR